MSQLRFLTAGESHGPGMTSLIEGLPCGLALTEDAINRQLARRQMGYGRGGRMKIERDEVEILSGVYQGHSTGSPVALLVRNRDYSNWQGKTHKAVTAPRPGHADLPGSQKYGLRDARIILERASARETTNRVACGAVGMRLLEHFGIVVTGRVVQVGPLHFPEPGPSVEDLHDPKDTHPLMQIEEMRRGFFALVDQTRRAGDTLGGIVEVSVFDAPPGLGSHVQWDRRLDALLAQAALSIPSVKAFEIGDGARCVGRPGSEFHDPMTLAPDKSITRIRNHAGGIEAGISNGQPITARWYFKPIATLRRGLPSVDMKTLEETGSDYERSDVTVLPAAAVVAESVTAWVLAQAFLEKFGGDTMNEVDAAFRHYRQLLHERTHPHSERTGQ